MTQTVGLKVIVLAAAIACMPREGLACGEATVSTEIRQLSPSIGVEAKFTTRREIYPPWLCPVYYVRAEGWIHGYGGAVSHDGAYVAEVKKTTAVNGTGKYQATGKHWAVLYSSAWHWLGETWGETDVTSPVAEFCPIDPWSCDGGGWVDLQECRCVYSPILVDMATDGYRLTSPENGVAFDLDGDGVRENTAWTEAGTDDAFLAIDKNGNGRIDSGQELFGNASPAFSESAKPTADNGFLALAFAERMMGSTAPGDGRIDSSDAVYSRLLLWTDLNHNGVSEPEELRAASEAGLVSISTGYKETKRRDRFGNEFKQRGRAMLADGKRERPVTVWDVWFATRQ